MHRKIDSVEAMKTFGQELGRLLEGGETITLVGDIGAGKTTLVKGIAAGLGIEEEVQSPSFTISRVYDSPSGLRLAHYDFYRLNDPGIMRTELHESANDKQTVTVIEWADMVTDVLPDDFIEISLVATDEESRQLTLTASGENENKFSELFA